MKTKFLLTLSVSALLMAAPAFAASEAPAKDTSTSTATDTAKPAEDAQSPAAVTEDNAMTKTDGDAQAIAPALPVETAPAAAAPAEHKAAEEGHHGPEVPDIDWSFNGPFGTFDRGALQRGFQVYKQVCSACHSMNRVYYRNLSALGYNAAEIKSIAAEASITDGPNDEGEMFERPGRPSDHFKSPFANDQAARSANGGALPPDLSLIVRARANGSNYVHGILTGYTGAPEGFTVNPGMNYNKYFPGHQIAMPQPLSDGSVTFEDGTPNSVDQMARDVTTFLTWASEPVMEKRKQTGVKVILFLLVFSGLMYMTKRKVWRDVH